MASKKKQVALVIGASRGMGRQIAIDLAKEGYHVVISAKTTSDASSIPACSFPPDPNSSKSTINTVEREIKEAGGSALAIPCDVRDVNEIEKLINETISRLGSLDVLVYNSGAIWWSSVMTTPIKRFQLMQRINPEGLYAAVSHSLPQFQKQGWKGRIVVVCPPIYSRFFRGKTAYAMGKVGMSVLVKGLAMDFTRLGKEGEGVGVTGIWPAAAIESAATQDAVNADQEMKKDLRKATIFSDAVVAILQSPTSEINGLLTLDEDFLRTKGVTDFSKYSVVPGSSPRRIMPEKFPALEVAEQDDEGRRSDSVELRKKRGKL